MTEVNLHRSTLELQFTSRYHRNQDPTATTQLNCLQTILGQPSLNVLCILFRHHSEYGTPVFCNYLFCHVALINSLDVGDEAFSNFGLIADSKDTYLAGVRVIAPRYNRRHCRSLLQVWFSDLALLLTLNMGMAQIDNSLTP